MKYNQQQIINEGPIKRLSLWRVMLAVVIILGLFFGAIYEVQQWFQNKIVARSKPWFAAYIDATAIPLYPFEQLGSSKTKNVILSFVVSSYANACTPSWGALYTLDQANQTLDLDRRIARLRQQGGNVAISFGGQRNTELAVSCKDTKALEQAYQTIMTRYKIDTIDMDIEGSDLYDTDAGKRRAIALFLLQKQMRDEKKKLAIWLTLPVTPEGLSEDGINAITQVLANHVDITGINVMTMDYGQSKDKNDTMDSASEKALNETHRQLGILYKQSGTVLSNTTLWAKIGLTPMIGQNDIPDEVFGLDDAKSLNSFATSEGIGRISMWSANRDIQCGDNYVDLKIVSDSCSGIQEGKMDFSISLSKNFLGNLSENAGIVTIADGESSLQLTDDPQKSPYQIWQESGAYLAGTKVVWHKNVYQAKWWTQGDIPDNPVLQSWQTPWQLVGPVLPGEKPIPQPTLPSGTYPRWEGTTTYDVGQRILFNGVPYQAKWWNQGNSPAASSANPDSSPWAPLTQQQVNEIVLQLQASVSAKRR